MGPVETVVTTAWADIQTRFTAAAAAAGLPALNYAFGVADWFSRMKYPVLFATLDYVRQVTESQQGEMLEIALNLVVVHTGSKPDTLETQMIGYTDALLELLRDDHTFGGACEIGEFALSDLYAGAQDSRELAIAIMTILLRKEILI